ncbi:MAG: WYL domain-containing protein [Lachnospiraceae bacterium]|nr:WYL domain-containing protein [Lachnospiraceae bacterium]
MPRANWQKIKLLKLAELLQQETDEQHPMTTNAICERMEQMEFRCDRRTLSKDITLLNDIGMEILWVWVGKQRGYYVADRSFSVPELRILIDAVRASNFITEKKTNELVEKIADLGGSHRAELLKRDLGYAGVHKHSNENIYYSVDSLEDAIEQKKKVIFRYFDIGIHGDKEYRRDGHHYVVEPVSLVFNEDNYYIVVYSARHDNLANYRVDRMEDVEVIAEDVSERALDMRKCIGEYIRQEFKMYDGELQTVVLEFDSSLVGPIHDRFGENLGMLPAGEDRYVTTVQVRVAPTFWGWLFRFAGKMKIISPPEIVEEYRKRAEKAVE